MGAKSLLVIAGVAIVTLLFLIYLAATFEQPEGTTTIAIAPPAIQPAEPVVREVPTPPVVAVTPTPEPAVVETPAQEPVAAEPEPPEEVVQLPSLGESDSFLLTRLRALQNGMALIRFLADDQLVRRFVVFVDNVSKGDIPDTNLPYRPMQQEMPVRNIDDNLFVMEEAAFHRFDQFVNAFVAVDTAQLMAIYRVTAPLFQQAYMELGYRDVSFDSVLRRAIMATLQTGDAQGPLQLVKPSVMYLYADADLEGMQDVQKQLIRLGPENSEKLKTKLRQFLQQL